MTTLVVTTADGAKHSLDVERMTFAEARAVERVSGMSIAEVAGGGSLTAVQALLWVTLKRSEPELRFADLDDRPIGDFTFDVTRDAEPDQDAEPDPTGPATEG